MSTDNNQDRIILPAGNYRARADRATVQFGRSKSGNDQVAITFDITDPKADGYPSRMTWIGTFAEGRATEIALDAIMATGWTGEDLLALEGVGDAECSIKVSHKQNEQTGTTYANIDFVNRLGGSFAFKEKLDEVAVGDLASRLGGAIMAARERAAGKGGANPSSGGRGNGGGGGYGGGRAPARGAAPVAWDGTGSDPNGDGIPFASCSPDADPMMRGMAIG